VGRVTFPGFAYEADYPSAVPPVYLPWVGLDGKGTLIYNRPWSAVRPREGV